MLTSRKLPSRLHHTAYTTKDMEKTRVFYEEVIGLPLVATWSESDELFGKVRTYCHCFFALADGGALAFFQFADKSDERMFSPPIAETPFHHIALKVDQWTQEEIEGRIKAAGYKEPDTFLLEHGYCRSVYIKDPNGMLLEFTLDAPDADRIAEERKADALPTLRRWLGATTHRTTFIGRALLGRFLEEVVLSEPPNNGMHPTPLQRASYECCVRARVMPGGLGLVA